MQPYFLPYIGYFQLISAVDLFVVYDNIKYTKKGWINRNRMLLHGKDAVFTLPLKHASDALDVCDRELATDFDRAKLLNQFREAYRKAPFFPESFPPLEQIVLNREVNLFNYLFFSITSLCRHLGIGTEIKVASSLDADHSLKGQDKVLALCQAVGAKQYINAAGGVDLYSQQAFERRGFGLKFIRSKPLQYAQFGAEFVPWLSIVDVLMFNSRAQTHSFIASGYELD